MRISNILPEKLSWHKTCAFFQISNPFLAEKWCEWPSTGLSLGDWGSIHDSSVPLWCLAYHFVSLWLASLIFKVQLGKLPLEGSFQLQMKRARRKNQMTNNYNVTNVTAQLYLTMVSWRLFALVDAVGSWLLICLFSQDKIAVIILHLQLHGVILILFLLERKMKTFVWQKS